MLDKLKYRVYDVLVETQDNELIDRIVAVFLMILILTNAVFVVLETDNDLNRRFGAIFHAVEVFSVTIFTIEYLLRLWIATLDRRFANPIFGRLKYAATPMAIIDLLAILPAFLPLLFAFDLTLIRFLRIFRLFRLLKMHRHVEALNSLETVVRSKREELFVILTMIMTMLVFAASLMYVVETEAQPDKFPSIPSAMWWAVATLTTVGYGDVYPITPLGKMLGAVIAFLGVGIFALPTGILASGFAEEVRKKREGKNKNCCPHCNGELT